MIAEAHLKTIDKIIKKLDLGDDHFLYYGSLAKCLHCIREEACTLLREAFEIYPLEAKTLFGVVPPRPLSGRWNQTSACEQFMLRGCSEHRARVMLEVLSKRSVKPDKEATLDPTAELSESIAKVKGRWCREVCKV